MKKRISIYFLILALLLRMGLFLTQKFNNNIFLYYRETNLSAKKFKCFTKKNIALPNRLGNANMF